MQYSIVKDIRHYCNISPQQSTGCPVHKISYYDLTFVLEGSLVYYANGEKIVLQKNDALFLPPGTMRARTAVAEPVQYVSFNFTILDEVTLPFDHYMPKCITATIRKLVSAFPPSHLSGLFHAREKCAVMLNFILYELLDAYTLKSDNEHVIKILNYIEEHITEKLTLQIVSTYMNLSKEYTSHIFKREIGKTLTYYVNERKLLLAKELILSREMSLSYISAYLGFDNYNYFSRLFKEYFGVTPMQLKKRKSGAK